MYEDVNSHQPDDIDRLYTLAYARAQELRGQAHHAFWCILNEPVDMLWRTQRLRLTYISRPVQGV